MDLFTVFHPEPSNSILNHFLPAFLYVIFLNNQTASKVNAMVTAICKIQSAVLPFAIMPEFIYQVV